MVKDLEGMESKFQHIYQDQVQSHLLTNGKSTFSNKELLYGIKIYPFGLHLQPRSINQKAVQAGLPETTIFCRHHIIQLLYTNLGSTHMFFLHGRANARAMTLWYEVTTEDMRPPGQQLLQQPAHDEGNARHPVRYTLYRQPGHLNNPPHPQQHALIQRAPGQHTGTARHQRNEAPKDETGYNHTSKPSPALKKMKLGEHSKVPAANSRTPSP